MSPLRSRRHALVLAGLLAGALPAAPALAEPAQTLVTHTAGPVREASAVSNAGTADVLAGAVAQAFFSDGSMAQAGFVVSGSSGTRVAVAETAAFLLAAGSDALADAGQPQEWRIINLDPGRTLTGFAIDGRGAGAGQAAFDLAFGASGLDEGTAGSAGGRTLLVDVAGLGFLQGTITTTYSEPVALPGAAAVGDLFARVEVAFAFSTAGIGGLPPPTQFNGVISSLRFGSDLDTVSYLATSPVPEPASALLLGVGLAGLAAAARRRQKAPAAAELREIADSLR